MESSIRAPFGLPSLSIFPLLKIKAPFGFKESKNYFEAMEPKCNLLSLLDYNTLVETAHKGGYLTKEMLALLEDWSGDPFNWGEKHGFAMVQK